MKFPSCIIEKGWDRYARWYDFFQPRIVRMMNFFGDLSFEEFQERVVELAKLKEGDRMLDVACGTGITHAVIVDMLGKRGELVAVDLSGEMLKRAKAKARRLGLKQVRYQKADVEELSDVLGEGMFDAVISVNGLPQFLHPDTGLREMVAVLCPGGRFTASTINRDECEKKFLLWPLMQLSPRLWSKEKYRRRLRELGLVRIRFFEEGLMLIMTGEKRRSRKRESAKAGK